MLIITAIHPSNSNYRCMSKEILAHVQEDMSKNVDSFTFSLLAKGEKPSPRSPLTKEEVGFCLHGGVLYSSKNERHAAT